MLRIQNTLLFVALVIAVATAFVPASPRSHRVSTTAVGFKFLKDMGLEKPSWLPDFGGKKEEEEAKAPAAESEDASEETEEVAAEEE